jgi:hypothetical protein
MHGTNVFIGEEDLKTDTYIQAYSVQKEVPARPVGFHGLRFKLECAFKLLTGKADIVIWKVSENRR